MEIGQPQRHDAWSSSATGSTSVNGCSIIGGKHQVVEAFPLATDTKQNTHHKAINYTLSLVVAIALTVFTDKYNDGLININSALPMQLAIAINIGQNNPPATQQAPC